MKPIPESLLPPLCSVLLAASLKVYAVQPGLLHEVAGQSDDFIA